MEEFKEYWERFTEWFVIFIQSRWIKTILLLSILIAFIVSIVFATFGCIVQPPYYNVVTNVKEVYGHLDWAIPALLFSAFGFVFTFIVMVNDPNSSKMISLGKFYRPWKLWYWMPTAGALAILEIVVRLFIMLLFGRYVNPKNNVVKKTSSHKMVVYNSWKLWYWIPTLGLAIPFEYIAIWIIKIQNNKTYYSDIIFFLILILILSMTLSVFAYNVRITAIRRYS